MTQQNNDLKLSLGRARGSRTAVDGFNNESDIVDKFNDWQNDLDAQAWLKTMGYTLTDIKSVKASKVKGNYKPDIQVEVSTHSKGIVDIQYISIKLVSNPTGFNQIDKRWVDKYKELWNLPDEIVTILKRFTGEIPPLGTTKDSRRTFLNEMPLRDQRQLVEFFTDNKSIVMADIIKGRNPYSADWFLVAIKSAKIVEWKILTINSVLSLFGQGEVAVTERGSLKIGRITMQRKGGDGGRDTAKMLQFKINPVETFSHQD